VSDTEQRKRAFARVTLGHQGAKTLRSRTGSFAPAVVCSVGSRLGSDHSLRREPDQDPDPPSAWRSEAGGAGGAGAMETLTPAHEARARHRFSAGGCLCAPSAQAPVLTEAWAPPEAGGGTRRSTWPAEASLHLSGLVTGEVTSRCPRYQRAPKANALWLEGTRVSSLIRRSESLAVAHQSGCRCG
jgi:hypothetical protein